MDNYIIILLDEEPAQRYFALWRKEIPHIITDPWCNPYKILVQLRLLRIKGMIPAPMPPDWVAPLVLSDCGRECTFYKTDRGWELCAPITT